MRSDATGVMLLVPCERLLEAQLRAASKPSQQLVATAGSTTRLPPAQIACRVASGGSRDRVLQLASLPGKSTRDCVAIGSCPASCRHRHVCSGPARGCLIGAPRATARCAGCACHPKPLSSPPALRPRCACASVCPHAPCSSNEAGVPFVDLARRYEREFLTDMTRLGVLPPDVMTRVSEVSGMLSDAGLLRLLSRLLCWGRAVVAAQ
jgi:hypothetical protein